MITPFQHAQDHIAEGSDWGLAVKATSYDEFLQNTLEISKWFESIEDYCNNMTIHMWPSHTSKLWLPERVEASKCFGTPILYVSSNEDRNLLLLQFGDILEPTHWLWARS